MGTGAGGAPASRIASGLGWLRRPWMLGLLAILVAAVLTVLVTSVPFLGGSGVGIVLYHVFVIAIAGANGYAGVRLLQFAYRGGRRPPLRRAAAAGLGSGFLVIAFLWSFGIPELWGPVRWPYELSATFVLAESLVVTLGERPRRVAYRIAPIYNAYVLGVTTAWFVLTIGPDVGGPVGVGIHGMVDAQTVVQAVNVSFLAFLSPVFVFPPLLSLPERWIDGGVPTPSPDPVDRRRRWRRRVARGVSFALSASVLYLSVALLIWTPLAISAVNGLDTLPPGYAAGFGSDPGARFGVVGAVLTDVAAPSPDWRSAIDHEVALAESLGVQYLRYDVQTQLLAASDGPAALSYAVTQAHDHGIGVILSPYGDRNWGTDHPTLAELNATLQQETAELVQGFHPDWIFPFFEPNGQLQIDLGHGEPTATWVALAGEAASLAKQRDPAVRVLIEIADSSQGLDLARGMASLPEVDAIGFDLYPTAASDLQHVAPYATLVGSAVPAKQFWISETGVNSLIFGEIGQARALAEEVRLAFTEWHAEGFCVWGLQDNVGEGLGPHLLNALGLVAFGGREKPAFGVYANAIAATRGASTATGPASLGPSGSARTMLLESLNTP